MRCPLALLFAVALPSLALAARKPVVESASTAPAWVREAAARTVSSPTTGLATLILHEERIVEPLVEGGVRMTSRSVVRVLKPAGMGEADGTGTTYGSEDDVVEAIDAWNLLPDGTMRRPDKKDDVMDVPWTAGGSVADDTRVKSLSLPGVVVGSVVAFETRVKYGLDRGAQSMTFGETNVPVALSRLVLRVPAGWSFEEVSTRTDAVVRAKDATSLTLTLTDLAPLVEEDWQPDAVEILPVAWVRWFSPDGTRGFRDWDAVGSWWRKLAEPTLAAAGEAVALSKSFAPADPASMKVAIERAFAFAARDVRYVSIQLGIGGFKPATPSATCSARNGDCKAKTFLMRSLVQPWGVTAYPVLVRTTHIGPVEPDAPSPGQFNHAIVALALPDDVAPEAWNVVRVEGLGRLAFFDATDNVGSAWDLPVMDQGTQALVVGPQSSRLVQLPVQPAASARHRLSLAAKIDAHGQMVTGEVSQEWSGAIAGRMRGWLAHMPIADREATVLKMMQSIAPGTRIVAQRSEGLEAGASKILQVVTLEGGRLGQPTSGLMLLRPGNAVDSVFARSLHPPPRRTPLDLPQPFEDVLRVTIEGPEGMVPEATPEPVAITSPLMEANATWKVEGSTLTYERTARLLVPRVEPADYVAFRDTLRKLQAAEQQAIVLVAAP